MGIDTCRFDYNKPLEEIKNVSLERLVLKKHSDFSKGKIAIKPYIQSLATVKEVKSVVECFDKEIGVSKMERIDNAFDTDLKLNEEIELFKTFLICLNIVRSKNVKIFETYIDMFDRGNIKIDNKITKETTVYSCEDKLNRKANTRIENRVKRIRNEKEHTDNLEEAISTYNAELKEILARLEEPKDNIIDMINKKIVPKLLEKYKSNTTNFRDLSNYLHYLNANGFLLTKGIIEGLLKGLGYKTPVNKYIKMYNARNENKLNYCTSAKLKKLVNDIIKENNETLKN